MTERIVRILCACCNCRRPVAARERAARIWSVPAGVRHDCFWSRGPRAVDERNGDGATLIPCPGVGSSVVNSVHKSVVGSAPMSIREGEVSRDEPACALAYSRNGVELIPACSAMARASCAVQTSVLWSAARFDQHRSGRSRSWRSVPTCRSMATPVGWAKSVDSVMHRRT